jgi:hypothetical protein
MCPEKLTLPEPFEEFTCTGYMTVGITRSRELWIAGRYRDTENFEKSEFSDVVAVSGGLQHVLVLNSAGEVFGWGGNSCSQLGRSDAEAPMSVKIIEKGKEEALEAQGRVVAIYSGSYSSMVLYSSGELFMWGQTYLPSYAGDVPKKLSGYTFFVPRSTETLWGEIFSWIFLGNREPACIFANLPVEVIFSLVQLYFL